MTHGTTRKAIYRHPSSTNAATYTHKQAYKRSQVPLLLALVLVPCLGGSLEALLVVEVRAGGLQLLQLGLDECVVGAGGAVKRERENIRYEKGEGALGTGVSKKKKKKWH